MTQDYEVPLWKKWSTKYCNKCFKSLGHYKGWYQIPLELYCDKCAKKIQREQQRLTEVAE